MDEFVPGQIWNPDYVKPRQLCIEYDVANEEHKRVLDEVHGVLDRYRLRKEGTIDGLCSTDYPLGDWPQRLAVILDQGSTE